MHPQRVIFKNEGSRVQTYRNMNVHVVDTYMLRPTWMIMDCMSKQTNQCAFGVRSWDLY